MRPRICSNGNQSDMIKIGNEEWQIAMSYAMSLSHGIESKLD